MSAALFGIMLLAALLRFTGQNWDQGQNLHPDERFITMVATWVQWPSSLHEYFDTAINPLNPYNNQDYPTFIYGTFPLYLDKLYGAAHRAHRIWQFPSGVTLGVGDFRSASRSSFSS